MRSHWWIALERFRIVAKYPYDKKTGKIKLPPELELEIANIVKNGDVVGAMRKVMDLTGAGLKFSQEYIDRFR